MNSSNPCESASIESKPSSSRLIDFLAVGLWLAIPVGVLIARRQLRPVFEDFDVELPTAAQYVLSSYSPVLFAIGSLAVLVAMFMVPDGSARRKFMWLAFLSGMLVGVACSLLILGPLSSLWQDLTSSVSS